MGKYAAHAGAILVFAFATGQTPASGFGAKYDKGIGRRYPTYLDTVVAELPAEESLVSEGGIDEIPVMRMLLVKIDDDGKETAALDCKAVGQGAGLDKTFLN